MWRHGQAVKTLPFHGSNTGSNPVGVTTCRNISKISHYNKLKTLVTNPIEAATVSRNRNSSAIKSADVRLANLLADTQWGIV